MKEVRTMKETKDIKEVPVVFHHDTETEVVCSVMELRPEPERFKAGKPLYHNVPAPEKVAFSVHITERGPEPLASAVANNRLFVHIVCMYNSDVIIGCTEAEISLDYDGSVRYQCSRKVLVELKRVDDKELFAPIPAIANIIIGALEEHYAKAKKQPVDFRGVLHFHCNHENYHECPHLCSVSSASNN